ncbi:unnamed protein product [Effrenium voratum]|nr:unnamed protein product [Effrenium voratum]
MGVCADHGADVAFTYQGEALAKRVKPLAESVGSDLVLPCDVTDDASMDAVFKTLEEKWGKLDFLVHAIAYADKSSLDGRYLDTTADQFAQAMNISCHSLAAVAKRAEPLMADGGSIATLTYYGAEKVIPHYNVMGVAKAALEASVRYLAVDLGRNNIRINAISAGPIKTLAAAGIGDFRYILKWNELNAPMKRTVTIDEVGKTGLYLLSDLASGVTGEVHHVDAGYHVVGMKAEDVKILSGTFQDESGQEVTTGTPISLMIENVDQRSKDYGDIKDTFRPGHADFTYEAKYGIRDYRGGGRQSARETAARVAAGALARKVMPGVEVRGALVQMGPHKIDRTRWDWNEIDQNPFWCPDPVAAKEWETYLDGIRKAGSSCGAVIELIASGVPAGLGAPIYGKLDADLAGALMSINAVKGVEIGDGFAAAALTGEENADEMGIDGNKVSFDANHAGTVDRTAKKRANIMTAPAPVSPQPLMARFDQRSGEMMVYGGGFFGCFVLSVALARGDIALLIVSLALFAVAYHFWPFVRRNTPAVVASSAGLMITGLGTVGWDAIVNATTVDKAVRTIRNTELKTWAGFNVV